MQQKDTTKIIALMLSVAFIILSFVHVDTRHIGMYPGCPLTGRFLYVLFHANILHALCNAYAMLSVVFVFNISLRRFLFCYLIAVSCPLSILSYNMPVIGASGMCYALFGSVLFLTRRRVYFACYFLAFIAIGFFFSNAAVLLHLYCFIVGIIAGFLNAPLWKRR